MGAVHNFKVCLLLVLAVLSASACNRDDVRKAVDSVCDAQGQVMAGVAAAFVVADPLLPALAPQWSAVYVASKAGILVANAALLRACERHRAGQSVDLLQVQADLAKLVEEGRHIADVLRNLPATRDVTAQSPPDLGPALAALEAAAAKLEKVTRSR